MFEGYVALMRRTLCRFVAMVNTTMYVSDDADEGKGSRPVMGQANST
jgi:hypothetical protein